MTDDEPIIEEKEDTVNGTTARIRVEVESDGGLTDNERVRLAIALLEHGTNADEADWDSDHPIPTVRNRIV